VASTPRLAADAAHDSRAGPVIAETRIWYAGVLRGEGLAESHDVAEVLGKIHIADPDASDSELRDPAGVRRDCFPYNLGWKSIYLPMT